MKQLMYNYTELENFWKRYNKVFLEKTALELEVTDLNEENMILMETVKKKAFKNSKLQDNSFTFFSYSLNDASYNMGS